MIMEQPKIDEPKLSRKGNEFSLLPSGKKQYVINNIVILISFQHLQLPEKNYSCLDKHRLNIVCRSFWSILNSSDKGIK